MSEDHAPLIKTPKQLVVTVVLAFVVPIVVILMIVALVVGSHQPTGQPDDVARRIRPVGDVRLAKGTIPTAAAAGARSGEQVVGLACGKCHQTGEKGAPKIGDRNAWTKRLKGGIEVLVAGAIKGHGVMPARGGFADLTDAELRNAIVYMFQSGGVSVPDVKTAAAAPGTATPPAAIAGAPAAAAPAAPAQAGSTASPAKPGGAADGKKVYDTACALCHAAGVAGAPKTGDKTAWAPRIKIGLDTLHQSALKGKGAMPPKGGNAALSDADVMAAVDYLVSQAK